MFPTHRPRRLRNHPQLRRMVRENILTTSDLIYPLFAVPGEAFAKEVKSMPGVYQLSVDKIVEGAKKSTTSAFPRLFYSGFPQTKIQTRQVLGTTAASSNKRRKQLKKPYQI